MAKAWSEVELSPEYQALPNEDKQNAKQQYFDTVVRTKPEFTSLSGEDQAGASGQFFGSGAKPQPDSIMNNMRKGQDVFNATANQFTNHPLKTTLQPLATTITGKSLEDRAKESNLSEAFTRPPSNAPFDRNLKNINPTASLKTSYAQGADLISNPINAFGGPIVKGVAQTIGAGAKAIESIAPAMKNTSYGLMNSIVRQLPKEFRYGQNAGRGMVKAGIKGNSAEEIAQNVGDKIDDISGTGDAIASRYKKPDNYNEAINVIDNKISELTQNSPRTNATSIKRLESAKKDILGVTEDAQGNITNVGQDLSNMTPSEALAFKRKYSDVTQWTGNASDDKLVNATLQKSRRLVKDKLNENAPGMKAWNEQYGDLAAAQQAARRQVAYDQAGRSLSHMASNIFRTSGVMGAVTAGLTGHVDLAAEILGTLVSKEVLNSPMVKSNLAQMLYKMSGSDKTKIIKAAPWLGNLSRADMANSGQVGELYAEPGVFTQPTTAKPILKLPAPKDQNMPQYLKDRQSINDNMPGINVPTGEAVSTNPIPLPGATLKSTTNQTNPNIVKQPEIVSDLEKQALKKRSLMAGAGGVTVLGVNNASAMEQKRQKVNPLMKSKIAKAENAGKATGDWAQLEDIVLRDLKQTGKLDKNITLDQVKKDPALYDHVVSLYLKRMDSFGIPEKDKALWWLMPGRYRQTGGDINKLAPYFKNIMQNRVKNMK